MIFILKKLTLFFIVLLLITLILTIKEALLQKSSQNQGEIFYASKDSCGIINSGTKIKNMTPNSTTQTTIVHSKATWQISSTKKPIIVEPKISPFECLRNPQNLPTLPNIETRKPKIGKLITFLETTCNSRIKGKINLNPRMACAVESAALHNPNFEVHLMFTSPAVIKISNNSDDKIIEALTSYKNIIISRIDIDQYFIKTPVEELYKSGLMETSIYPYIHLSDVLRSVVMWKYGTIYLDLDMITLRNFDDLEPNFTGFLADGKIGAAALKFEATGKGHEWIEMILKDINKSFDPNQWAFNANLAVNRFLSKICNTTKLADMNAKRCQGFQIYDNSTFYPLHFQAKDDFWNPAKIKQGLSILKNARSVHLYHSSSYGMPVRKGEKSALEIICMINCPKVYAQMQDIKPFK